MGGPASCRVSFRSCAAVAMRSVVIIPGVKGYSPAKYLILKSYSLFHTHVTLSFSSSHILGISITFDVTLNLDTNVDVDTNAKLHVNGKKFHYRPQTCITGHMTSIQGGLHPEERFASGRGQESASRGGMICIEGGLGRHCPPPHRN